MQEPRHQSPVRVSLVDLPLSTNILPHQHFDPNLVFLTFYFFSLFHHNCLTMTIVLGFIYQDRHYCYVRFDHAACHVFFVPSCIGSLYRKEPTLYSPAQHTS